MASYITKNTTNIDKQNLEITGIAGNNIKNLDIKIPHNKIIALTGISGAGKSTISNAIHKYNSAPYNTTRDNFYNNLSSVNIRINDISGIRPSILMDQKNTRIKNKSTVGTMTEVYKYLRYIFSLSFISKPFSPTTNEEMKQTPISTIISNIIKNYNLTDRKISIVFKFYSDKFEHIKECVQITDVHHIELHNVKYLSANSLESNFVPGMYTLSILNSKIESIEFKEVEEKIKLINSLKDKLKIQDIKPFIRVMNSKNDILHEQFITNSFYCHKSNIIIDKVSSKLFSFNTPEGSCKSCQGLGYEKYIDQEKIIPNARKSINEGGILLWKTFSRNTKAIYSQLSEKYNFDLNAPIESLTDEVMKILLYGTSQTLEVSQHKSFYIEDKNIIFPGIINLLKEKLNHSSVQIRNSIEKFLSYRNCQACNGYRLSKASLCFKINKSHIGEVSDLNLIDLEQWLLDLNKIELKESHKNILSNMINPIIKKITILREIGLFYLSLSRLGNTLSGGEIQRLRLAEQLQHKLSRVIFVLDEPSSGLHIKDQDKIMKVIKYLKNLGNTVILVEHNLALVKHAEYILDIGPKAGIFGGKIVAQGEIKDIFDVKESITGQYLNGTNFIEYNTSKELISDNFIELINAHSNNLKNLDIKIPISKCTIISGPSGCGKTTLIINTLYKALVKEIEGKHLPNTGKYDYISIPKNIKGVMHIDQKPIGKTSRSNLSTYIGVFDAIRNLFASQPEAKKHKFTSSHFSFNIKEGSCVMCLGTGIIKNEVSYLFDSNIICEECNGMRYKKEILKIQYKGKSIMDVLSMSVAEAVNFFTNESVIYELLKTVNDIGLGYLTLGHSAMDLSGGETQRLKICKELSKFLQNTKIFNKTSNPHVVYIIDELNIGLHIHDTARVLALVKKLTQNNTVIIIDHNIHSIKKADYIIDIGPGSSKEGGRIVAEGTPMQLIENPNSVTGPFLKEQIEEDLKNHIKHGRKTK